MNSKTIAMAIPGPLPQTPAAQSSFSLHQPELEAPIIDKNELFPDVVQKITSYITKAIDSSYSYEQIRTCGAGQRLRPLVTSLTDDCHHSAIVAAILASRWLFTSTDLDDTGVNESRGLACELVAWEFLTCLSERELMDHLLHELPEDTNREDPQADMESRPSPSSGSAHSGEDEAANDQTPLLQRHQREYGKFYKPPKQEAPSSSTSYRAESDLSEVEKVDDPTKPLAGLNALEIAAVANAKKFLAQRLVQGVVRDIWDGNIIFWESLSVNAVKRARVYNKRIADPYARLRVPKYAKAIQICFFAALFALYYAVLIQRHPHGITVTEVFLYIWIAAFAYDEFGEFKDAGVAFYQTDFWSLWDLGIIITGIAFLIFRAIGLLGQSDYLTDLSFDTLALLALFLVPRLFSLASLNPYFGSLIPVLKEMTKDVIKFLPVVVIIYLGFLSTFSMLARDRLSLNEMSWLLIKVFFGSSYLGFDVAAEISPLFGPTLMLIFVTLTNILLITSLISLLSNSLTEVMAHAREEYLFQYSIYVLESGSTSSRLTYFFPPLNLIALLFRPLRLVVPAQTLRQFRILILKATHAPFVAIIFAYESSRLFSSHRSHFPPAAGSSMHINYSRQGRPLSSNLSARFTALKPALAPSTPQQPSQHQQHLPGSSSSALSTADVAEMLTTIQKLSSQVDELSMKVAGQSKD
ncbi:hypothetical protein GJ744_002367 [Endocarpon pusillum]|uniref:Calcium channel YVC1-like C-terminal transmembrane domain-containing protein n=1 Tax=Endocarpon pusillum TaxID=364733 RepID=A0A8H7AMZ8_9EURO|nr:hypothetical protein GJ744_002367 [Endocarpon pusillum]